jgi:hypothetical protein
MLFLTHEHKKHLWLLTILLFKEQSWLKMFKLSLITWETSMSLELLKSSLLLLMLQNSWATLLELTFTLLWANVSKTLMSLLMYKMSSCVVLKSWMWQSVSMMSVKYLIKNHSPSPRGQRPSTRGRCAANKCYHFCGPLDASTLLCYRNHMP